MPFRVGAHLWPSVCCCEACVRRLNKCCTPGWAWCDPQQGQGIQPHGQLLQDKHITIIGQQHWMALAGLKVSISSTRSPGTAAAAVPGKHAQLVLNRHMGSQFIVRAFNNGQATCQ